MYWENGDFRGIPAPLCRITMKSVLSKGKIQKKKTHEGCGRLFAHSIGIKQHIRTRAPQMTLPMKQICKVCTDPD